MTFTNVYGITIGNSSASGSLNAAAITDMLDLGVTWLRYQVRWSLIDATGTTNQNGGNGTTPGTYSWGAYDSAVSQCNAAGINILLSIMFAPTQFQGPGGNPLNPSYTATFASQIATRYDGTHGHGTIQGIEVGNEDYNSGADTTTIPVPLVQSLALTMKAVYPAIKAVSSAITVGVACKLQRNTKGYTAFFDTLLNPSTGPYISSVFQGDYINFHYYGCLPTSGGNPVSMDPTVDLPSWNGGAGLPSITHAWQLIDAKRTQYSQTVPIWLTEAGYQVNANPGRAPACNNSEAQAWTYDNAVLDSLRTSNVVSKWFRFTLGYYAGYAAPNYRDGMSLVQGTLASPHKTAAYNGLKTYAATYPTWGSGTGATWSASPNSLSFSATTGGANPANQTVTLSNTAGSSASYTVVDSAAWMSVAPTSGSVAAGGTANSTISVNISGLTAGTYTGSVTWTAGGQSDTTSVVLTVSDVTPPPPPGVTPFTAYFANAASPVTPTANQVYIIPGTPVDVNTASTLGTALNFGELIAQGTTNPWAASTTIGGPSGFGFLLGAKLLEGNDLQPGTYTGAVRLNMIGAGAVSITADIHVRLWKWNAVGGYTTQIVDCVQTGQTILTTKVNFAPTGTTSVVTSFGAGDKLYIEIKVKVLTNTGPSTAQIQLNDLSTDTVTFMGSSTASVVTPGYSPTGSGGGSQVFPLDCIWNRTITDMPVHPSSSAYIAAIGSSTPLLVKANTTPEDSGGWSIPYNLVTNSTPTAMVSMFSASTSYPGPYPIPATMHIEEPFFTNSDRHLLCVNTDSNLLYEITGFKALGYQTAVLADSPWAYYRIGGNGYDYWWANAWTVGPVTDLSGNGYHASLPNSGVTQLIQQSAMNNGDGNTSASFDGSTGYIALPSGLNPSGWTSVTFEWWEYITSTTNYPVPLSNAQADSSHTGFHIYLNDTVTPKQVTIVVGTSSSSVTNANAGAGITLNTWQHVVVTADGTTVKTYINGSLITSTGLAFSSLVASTNPVSIGWVQASNANFVTGRMSDVAIYKNTVLSAARVLAHYNAGITVTGPFVGTSGWNWDMSSNAMPPFGTTAGDAASMPVFAGLVRYEEVATGVISHAFRCIIPTANGAVWPASDTTGTTGPYPPFGTRFRLKASFNISGYAAQSQVILTALKRYGALLADEHSAEFQLNGPSDPLWDNTALTLINTTVTLADFEIVDESTFQVVAGSMQAVQAPFVPPPAVNPSSLTIGNTTVNMVSGSLQGKSKVGRRGELSCTVYDALGANHYQQYQQMALFDQLSNLVYSGYLTSPVETKPGFSPMLLTSFTATDQHYLADKRIVANLYRDKTCGFIVQDIVTNILAAEGVTVGQIDAGLTIPIANFGYCTVATALDALVAAASGNGIPFYWVIDQNQVLWFVPYTAITGPSVDGTTIDDGRRSGVLPSVTRANPKYRNTQYAVGGFQENGPWDETRQGDGQTRAFTFSYPLNAAPTTFTLNGTAKSIAIKGTVGAQYYWAPNDPVIAQDPTQTILVSTDRLHMIYAGQSSAVFNNQHVDQVAYMQGIDGTSGIVEAVITDPTINSFAQGQSVVGQGLTRYCTQGLLFTWATLQTGYAPGQLITVSYGPFGFSGTQMLVDEVAFSDQQDGFNLWYTITAVMGPYDTNWTDFFGNIINPGLGIAQSINIGVAIAVPLYPSSTLFPSDTLYPS